MNAIILTAIWGVLMMFSGVFMKNKKYGKKSFRVYEANGY
jgi:hypothetical protein